MKKIILLITASLMFLTAEDVKIKSAGTDADGGVVFKNSIDSTLVDIDGTGVVNIKGIPAAGATLRLFEAFGNGSNYLQLNPGVSLAENATWHLSSAGGSGNMFLGFESGSAVLSSGAANIGLGYNAAKALTSGVRNVALGYKALALGTSANYNITIGYQAGNVITTGQKNIIIGTDADPSAASGENQIVIGYEAVGTADNQVVLGNSSTTQWVPGSADATDLGSTAKEFNNVYLGDGAVVNLGVDQDVSLTHIADTGVRMNGTSQLQFRDGNLKVSSSADGQLDMDADNELELVAPMVDINASTEVNISSELKVGGKVTTGSEGAGVDVVFYSNTSGDDFTWDASEEKLVITGSNGQDALHILDGDLRVVDKIYGDGSGLTGLTVSSVAGDLTVAGEENNSGTLNLYADEGDDDNDKWRLQTANGGSMTIDSKQSESWATLLTVGNTGNAALAGDLTVTGDDLTMATNTSGAALIGDGTNFNPVVISGDISVGANGAAAIGSGVIVNADVSSGAAITDSKLATISTANKVGLAALDIDGGTDIGAAIVDADLFIIDDGAGGTNKKVTASRLKTYAQSGVSSAADDITTGDAAVTIATSSGAVNITPAAGSAIVLDGTINVERGVVSGATSVTSVIQIASTSLQTPLLEYTDGDDAITIADGGAITTAANATVTGDLTVTGNDVTFGNGESISNATDGTVAITATTTTTSGALTAAGVVTANTGIIPDAADGAYLGSASAEFSDLFLADGSVINLGNDQDVKITHDPDDGLELKSTATADNNPFLLTLQTGETDIVYQDVLGAINFQAPDEASGGDAVKVVAGIEAIADGTFGETWNGTKLSFKTTYDDVATEKMSLSASGYLNISGDMMITGNDLNFGNYEYISNYTNGELALGAATTRVTGDLTVSGNDITFGNSEYIDNNTNGRLDLNATTTQVTGDLTVTGNDITFGNGETISNATNGTIAINANVDFSDKTIAGYGATVQTLSGTSLTLDNDDNGTIINVTTTSAAITIQVPSGLATGFNCMVIQSGTQTVTLDDNSDATTLNARNGLKTAGRYAIVTLVHIGSNVYVVSGDTKTS